MLFYFNSFGYFPAVMKCSFIIYLSLNVIFKSSFVENEEQETFTHHKLINGFDILFMDAPK